MTEYFGKFRIRTMVPLRAFTLFIAVGLLTGCKAPRNALPTATTLNGPAVSDEEQFGKIVDYYRKTFPMTSLASGRNVYFVDGRYGERLHISVPVAVQAEYRHPYTAAFLAMQSTSTDGLARMIADRLVLLKNEVLFTHTSRVSHGGGVFVDCISYVVKTDRNWRERQVRGRVVSPAR